MWNRFDVAFLRRTSGLVLLATLTVGCSFGHHGGGGGGGNGGGGGGTGPSITITTTSLPNGSYGNNYKQSLAATGDSGTLSWSLSGGMLPPGLALGGSNSQPNILSGIPAQLGTFPFNVTVSDTTGHSASQALSITINASAQLLTAGFPYAFQFKGYDANGPVLMLGSFTPGNDGSSFSGTIEINSVTNGRSVTSNFDGNFIIGGDGRGKLTVTSLPGSPVFAFAFDSVGNTADVIEFDKTGTHGTGFIQFQHPGQFALGNIAGSYALRLVGEDHAGKRFAALGGLSLDGSGNISSNGTLDFNDSGTTSPAAGLQISGGSYSLVDSSNGRGTITLNCPSCPSASIALSFLVIKGSKLLVMSADPLTTNEPIGVGVLRGQAGPFDNSAIQVGSASLAMAGVSASNSTETSVLVGEFSWNDSSLTLSGEEDSNDGGTLTQSQVFSITNVSISNGRGSATLVDSRGNPLMSIVFYTLTADSAFVMESPGVEVRVGAFFPRSLSGTIPVTTWISGTDYPPISGLPNSDAIFAISGNGNINGNEDLDVPGSGPTTYSLGGGSVSPADSNGRGTITMSSNGGLGGSTKLVYYLVSTVPPSAVIMGTNTASSTNTAPVLIEAQQQ
jgi:hypothetical protein